MIRRAVLAFLALKLLVALVNLRAFPRLSRDPGRDVSDTSILVPARDEAHNLERTLRALLAQGAGEVLVLDDASADGTALVAAAHGARVLRGSPPPPGWLGKPWACHQLAAAAKGRWLVFTDADVRWGPGALGGLRNLMDHHGARVGSVFATQETATLGERLTVTLIDDVLLSFLPHPLVHADVTTAAVAVSGGVLAFEREAYARVGGHAAVADRVLDDVVLGRLARRAGEQVAVAVGAGVIRLRMYRGYSQVVEGFGKNLRAAHAGSALLVLADLAWHLLAYTAPVALAARDRRWRLPVLVALLQRAVVLAISGRPVAEAALAPLHAVAAVPVAVQALRRRQYWKGRVLEGLR